MLNLINNTTIDIDINTTNKIKMNNIVLIIAKMILIVETVTIVKRR